MRCVECFDGAFTFSWRPLHPLLPMSLSVSPPGILVLGVGYRSCVGVN